MARANLYPPSPKLPKEIFEEFNRLYLHLRRLDEQLLLGYGLAGPYATILDETSPTVAYFGEAATNSIASAAVWRIRKYTTVGAIVYGTWADGNASFDNVWNDRAILSYS